MLSLKTYSMRHKPIVVLVKEQHNLILIANSDKYRYIKIMSNLSEILLLLLRQDMTMTMMTMTMYI